MTSPVPLARCSGPSPARIVGVVPGSAAPEPAISVDDPSSATLMIWLVEVTT